jgi:hypothetical protein
VVELSRQGKDPGKQQRGAITNEIWGMKGWVEDSVDWVEARKIPEHISVIV